MNKTCVWCGATLAATDRVCGKCLSAQPSTPQDVSPPPAPYPPTPYPPTPYAGYAGYGPPPGPPPRSNTGRTVAIVIGACVFGVVAIAFVCILAVTFLGQKSSSKFVAISPTASVPSGGGTGLPDRGAEQLLDELRDQCVGRRLHVRTREDRGHLHPVGVRPSRAGLLELGPVPGSTDRDHDRLRREQLVGTRWRALSR